MRRGCSIARTGASSSAACTTTRPTLIPSPRSAWKARCRPSNAITALPRFIYGLTFQRVAIDPNSLVIDPTLIALYSKPVFIAMPTFTMVRDRRDDPINPKKGSLQRAEPWPGHQRAGIANQFRPRPARQLDLLHLQEELGNRAADADRHREAIWHQRLHRCQQDSAEYHPAEATPDSFAGIVLLRRQQFIAQLLHQSGRSARHGNRLPYRRPGVVRQ